VPVIVTDAGEFVALLTKLTLPLAGPEICGAKLTLTDLVAPAATASGNVTPLMLYPVPVTFPDVTEIAPVPLFVRITGSVLEFPVNTLPNVSEVGETLSRNVAGAAPEPVSVTVGAPVAELLVTVTEPFKAPVVVGANTTLPTAEAPGTSVSGTMNPLTLYPAPDGVIAVMLRSAVPVFFSVNADEVELPVVMLPNPMLVGVTVI
jgi:hypothetical protein